MRKMNLGPTWMSWSRNYCQTKPHTGAIPSGGKPVFEQVYLVLRLPRLRRLDRQERSDRRLTSGVRQKGICCCLTTGAGPEYSLRNECRTHPNIEVDSRFRRSFQDSVSVCKLPNDAAMKGCCLPARPSALWPSFWFAKPPRRGGSLLISAFHIYLRCIALHLNCGSEGP